MARTCRLLTLVASLIIAASASAQSARGSIAGVIIDEQGQPVRDVFVTAHGTDQSQMFKTDAAGRYRLQDLVAGRYVLTAARDGYVTVVRNGVMVRVGKIAELPLTLKIATDGDAPQQAPAHTLTARFRGLNATSSSDGSLPSYNPIAGLPPSSVVVAGLGSLQNRR